MRSAIFQTKELSKLVEFTLAEVITTGRLLFIFVIYWVLGQHKMQTVDYCF